MKNSCSCCKHYDDDRCKAHKTEIEINLENKEREKRVKRFKFLRKYHDLIVDWYNFKFRLKDKWDYTLGSLFERDWTLSGSWKSNLRYDFAPKLRKFWMSSTPLFKNTYILDSWFVSNNGSKLLDYGLTFSYIRDRSEDQKYYWLKHHFGFVRIWEQQTLRIKDGKEEVVNLFLEGICNALSDESVPEYKTIKNKIFSGFAITKKQFEKSKEKIKELTPNLGWFEYEDEDESDLSISVE